MKDKYIMLLKAFTRPNYAYPCLWLFILIVTYLVGIFHIFLSSRWEFKETNNGGENITGDSFQSILLLIYLYLSIYILFIDLSSILSINYLHDKDYDYGLYLSIYLPSYLSYLFLMSEPVFEREAITLALSIHLSVTICLAIFYLYQSKCLSIIYIYYLHDHDYDYDPSSERAPHG